MQWIHLLYFSSPHIHKSSLNSLQLSPGSSKQTNTPEIWWICMKVCMSVNTTAHYLTLKSKNLVKLMLVKLTNNLFLAADVGSISILLLLDPSAAFDIISHPILPDRLSNTSHRPPQLVPFPSLRSHPVHLIKIMCLSFGFHHHRCAPGLCPGDPALHHLPSAPPSHFTEA